MSPATINLAEYLYHRLVQLGCKSLHGLPGDFNLLALDFVEACGLRWVGNCNELNAGYAADAYGRVAGLGAIMTTFGVGELSAVNAIAGSYAELAPVVHIVGTPPRAAQEQRLLLHHTLGNGDYEVYARIFKEITVAQADLLDTQTAPAEIDRVLRACCLESRPVYIQLPTDMVTQQVDASLLNRPVEMTPGPHDLDAEEKAIALILDRLSTATYPAILVDGGVPRRRMVLEVDTLIRKLALPVFVTPMGKGAVNEELSFFCGVYAGEGSNSAVKAEFEKSDLVLTIGAVESDLNTTGFTTRYPKDGTIAIDHAQCVINDDSTFHVPFRSLIPKLTARLDAAALVARTQRPCFTINSTPSDLSNNFGDGDTITHKWLWPRLTKWFQEDDIIVTDTGTSYVGYWGSGFRKGTQVINQILWSSIGYGVGAAQGAALAAKDSGGRRRTICFEGDGSFQLTAQELSTIIKHDLDVTMFLIENDGYTIERFVHGLEAAYNDVARWSYAELPHVFAQQEFQHRIKTWKISTRQQLENLLDNPQFQHGKGLRFVEMHMPKLDAPQVLIDFGENAAKRAS